MSEEMVIITNGIAIGSIGLSLFAPGVTQLASVRWVLFVSGVVVLWIRR